MAEFNDTYFRYNTYHVSGMYTYDASSTTADYLNDSRRYTSGGSMITEICTSTGLTKGAGTWDKISQIEPSGNLVIPKHSGVGIKVDASSPTFGWKDLLGQIVPRPNGGPAPTLGNFNGVGIQNYAFNAADVIDNITFHIPHDYVPGTDIYLHPHWGHNGTSISGNFIINWYAMYAKGYNQAAFNAVITIPQTIATPDVSTYPRWYHQITEFALTNATGDATHLDRNLIEIDGLIIIGLNVNTIPTISGGTPNQPYIFMIDLHYQSTQMSTKDKNYPFFN